MELVTIEKIIQSIPIKGRNEWRRGAPKITGTLLLLIP